MTEGTGPTVAGSAEPPMGVRQRLAWRSPALGAVDGLLLGIQRRTRAFSRGSDRLVAWHDQLARRAEPWGGWPALALTAPAEGPTFEPHHPRPVDERAGDGRPDVMARPASGTTTPTPTGTVGSGGATASRGAGAPLRIPRAARLARPGEARLSGHDAGAPRSAIRLASLRPTPDTPARAPRSPSDTLPGWPAAPAGAARRHATTSAEPSPPRFGPILSASPSPRREVRGGFPAGSADGAAPPPAGAPVVAPSPAAVRPRAATEGLAQHAPAGSPASPSTFALARAADDAPSLVERLAERGPLPAPLPGLEIRLVPPEEQVRSEAVSREEPGRPPPESEARAVRAASTPPLDLDAIADRVYQTLQRRQQFERERRGLY